MKEDVPAKTPGADAPTAQRAIQEDFYSRDYQRGYSDGFMEAMKTFDKTFAALRNPPPILVDASSLDPDFLASLMLKAPTARPAPAERSDAEQKEKS